MFSAKRHLSEKRLVGRHVLLVPPQVTVERVPDGRGDSQEDGQDDEIYDGLKEPLLELELPQLRLGLGIDTHQVLAENRQVDGRVEPENSDYLPQECSEGPQVVVFLKHQVHKHRGQRGGG